MVPLNGQAIRWTFVSCTPLVAKIFSTLAGLDYPYIATLLPNTTIEIHSVETQAIVQVIPPTLTSSPGNLTDRLRLASCLNGYLVPSSQRSDKMRMTSVPLLRRLGGRSGDAEDVGSESSNSELGYRI